MGEVFFKRLFVLFLLVVSLFFVMQVIKNNNADVSHETMITGMATHPLYSGFSSPEPGFTFNNNSNLVSVSDTVIYKIGYYSVNGAAWQNFSLLGATYPSSTSWLSDSAAATLSSFGVGEHYVIIYSCTYSSSWDCQGGKWQLFIFNNVISSCSNGLKDGDETGVDCGGSCGVCSTFLRTFYVSNSGNDSANGTSPSTAWKTISKVNNYALFQPGDGILFERDGTWREQLIVPRSGNATNYITFGAYGIGNKPKLYGSNTTVWTAEGHTNIWKSTSTFADPYTIHTTEASEIFFVYSNGSISWSNERKTYSSNFANLVADRDWTWNANTIYIYSTANPNAAYSSVEIPQIGRVIYIGNYDYLAIDNLEIKFTSVGIDSYEQQDGQNKIGFTLSNSKISYIGSLYHTDSGDAAPGNGYGTAVMRSNLLFTGNDFSECGRRLTSSHLYGASNLVLTNMIYENNYFHDGYHGDLSPRFSSGNNKIDGIIIRNNTFYEPPDKVPGIRTTDFISLEASGAGTTEIKNIQIYNNLFMYCTQWDIQITANIKNLSIYNNDFYEKNTHTASSMNLDFIALETMNSISPSDVRIKNNIFYNTGLHTTNGEQYAVAFNPSTHSTSVSEMDYNLFYYADTYLGLVRFEDGSLSYRTAGGTKNMIPDIYNDFEWQQHSPTNYLVAPGFVSVGTTPDLHLAAGSPAIGAGINVGLTIDYEGNPYGNPPSIGAFEYTGVISQPQPNCSDGIKNQNETDVDCGGICSACFSGRIFYVSTSGSDSNNGSSQSTPWKTLTYAESHATSPGDIIALKRGDTWSTNIALGIHHGGIAGKPIIWDGGLWGPVGSPKAIIARNADGVDSTYYSVVNIRACSYVTFQNITVDADNHNVYGLVIGGHNMHSNAPPQNNESNIIVQDCLIKNCGHDGFYCQTVLIQTWNTDMSNITLRRNTIDGANNQGICFYPGRTDLYQCYNPYEIRDSYVGDNTVTNTGRNNDGINGAIFINNKITNTIVEHNIVTSGADGHGFGIVLENNEPLRGWFPTGTIIRYNDVRLTESYPLAISHGQAMTANIYGNLFYCSTTGVDYSSGGIWIMNNGNWTGAKFNFSFNTIITEGGNSYKDDSFTAGIVNFRNNIVINKGLAGDYVQPCMSMAISGSTTHSNNALYKSGGDWTYVLEGGNYKRAAVMSTWEPSMIVGNPLLVDEANFNWHLKSNSSVIGKGIFISGIAKDYDGINYSNPPSIGAFEYP